MAKGLSTGNCLVDHVICGHGLPAFGIGGRHVGRFINAEHSRWPAFLLMIIDPGERLLTVGDAYR